MDVLRELRWARWGPMVVREIQTEGVLDRRGKPLKIVTPKGGQTRRKGYDVFSEKRSLLDDLLETADSKEHHAMLSSAVGADEKLVAERMRRADEIHETDIAAAASRWGFLMPEVYVEGDKPDSPLYEPFALWSSELRALRNTWELLRTGGNLSSFTLRLFAYSLVDETGKRTSDEKRIERGLLWEPGPAERALRSDQRAEGARGLLEQALTKRLSRGDVEIVFKGTRYALRPNSLAAAAWLELGDRVLRARPEKTCPQCGGAFVPPTVRRVYCSEKCKDDAKNARRSKKKTTRRAR